MPNARVEAVGADEYGMHAGVEVPWGLRRPGLAVRQHQDLACSGIGCGHNGADQLGASCRFAELFQKLLGSPSAARLAHEFWRAVKLPECDFISLRQPDENVGESFLHRLPDCAICTGK